MSVYLVEKAFSASFATGMLHFYNQTFYLIPYYRQTILFKIWINCLTYLINKKKLA